MRHLFGLLIAGGLLLGATGAATAQDLNTFGGYPAGITTGSPYGANWSGYYGLNPGGYPLNTYTQPYNVAGPNYRSAMPMTTYGNSYVPGTSSYNSGYVAPGRTYTYGSAPGYTTTSPGYTTYGTNAYGSNYYNTTRRGGLLRRGLFGNRR